MEQLDFFLKDKKDLFEKLTDIEDFIGQCPKGVDVTIKEHKNKRSTKQFDNYWQLLYIINVARDCNSKGRTLLLATFSLRANKRS